MKKPLPKGYKESINIRIARNRIERTTENLIKSRTRILYFRKIEDISEEFGGRSTLRAMINNSLGNLNGELFYEPEQIILDGFHFDDNKYYNEFLDAVKIYNEVLRDLKKYKNS